MEAIGLPWEAGVNNYVNSIAVSDNDIYVGGVFTTAGGAPAGGIAKWNGASWSALGSGANISINSIAVRGNDLYVGGYFTTIGGVITNNIAKWNGSNWSTLGSGTDYAVNSIGAGLGSIYVGGVFSVAGNNPSIYFGRYQLCPGSINPTSQSFPSNGGNGQVNVTSTGSCTWTAVSDVPWASITSGSTGSGNSVVNYSVASNQVANDANTLLLLQFENTLNGAGGETPTTATNVSFTPGKNGVGANFPSGNQLFYPSAGNINATEGSVEFWVKPSWNGNDGIDHTFLLWGTSAGSILLGKDAANNLRLILNRFGGPAGPEVGTGFNINNWVANQWRHLGFVWSDSGKFARIYIDGVLSAQGSFTISLPAISASTFQIGGIGAGSYVNSVIDDFRISNIARTSIATGEARTGTLTIAEQTFTITQSANCPAIAVNPSTLPVGTAGTPYNQTLTASGGAMPYAFTIIAGALPAGLSLSSGGAISGSPTAFGSFNFTVRATDINGCTGERAYTLTVNPPCGTISLTPSTLPNGLQGAAYNQALNASGGVSPYNFTVSSGTLPTGLNLSSAGLLSGTPTLSGLFNFTVRATDASNCVGDRAYTLTVSGGGSGLTYYPLAHPIRLLDTRQGATGCFTPSAPLQAGIPRTQPARVTCDGVTIPANAAAVVGNATVVNFISGGGFITLWPTGAAQPTVSNLNYTSNQIIPNSFTVGLNANGEFNIFATTSADFIIDITGYYAPPAAGGLFYHPLPSPIRLLDTRQGAAGCSTPGAPLQAGTPLIQNARLTCNGITIPANAQAAVSNATVVNFISSGGFITLWPTGANQPTVSNLNYLSNQIIPNAFTVGLGANGEFSIFASGATDFIADITGYYSSDPAADVNGVVGLLYNPLASPIRLLDTRPAAPACTAPGAPLAGGQSLTQQARVVCNGVTIPANAAAVVGNATVVNFISGGGFITLFPAGAQQPTVSNLNYLSNQIIPNAFTVGLGANGEFNIFASSATHFIADLTGYFAP